MMDVKVDLIYLLLSHLLDLYADICYKLNVDEFVLN